MLCLQWQSWIKTRRLFAPPPPAPSILGRMQPHLIREAPDAPLSADLAAFDVAVRALPENRDKAAFLMFYRSRKRRPVKTMAADLGVSRVTFYAAVRRVRREAYSLSVRLRQLPCNGLP